jgi:hypothetical protein
MPTSSMNKMTTNDEELDSTTGKTINKKLEVDNND